MIAIVLAGGLGTRLRPLTDNTSKVLLPLDGKPTINYLIDKLMEIQPPLNKILVSTTIKYQSQFQDWENSAGYSNISLVPDNIENGKIKLGAIRALSDVVSVFDDDLLVIAGDNLFFDDFNNIVHQYYQNKAPIVALYHAKDFEDAKKGGIALLGPTNRILNFTEKPKFPESLLIGACFYIFPSWIKTRLSEFVVQEINSDEPGRFISWLCEREPVFGFLLNHYVWDIGTLESYYAANLFLKEGHNIQNKGTV